MKNLITTKHDRYGEYILSIGNEFRNTTYTTVQSVAEKFTDKEIEDILKLKYPEIKYLKVSE